MFKTIELTTPYTPGNHPRACIRGLSLDLTQDPNGAVIGGCTLSVEYGNVVSGEWVKGAGSAEQRFTIRNQRPPYDTETGTYSTEEGDTPDLRLDALIAYLSDSDNNGADVWNGLFDGLHALLISEGFLSGSVN